VVVVCASASLLFGCSTTKGGEGLHSQALNKVGQLTPSIGGDEQALIKQTLLSRNGELENYINLYSATSGDAQVTLIKGSDIERLFIADISAYGNLESAKLSNPSRIVLDFEKHIEFNNTSQQVQSTSKYIKDVRIASVDGADNKVGPSRIVIELADGAGKIKTDIAKVADNNIVVTIRDAKYKPKVNATDVAGDMAVLSKITTPATQMAEVAETNDLALNNDILTDSGDQKVVENVKVASGSLTGLKIVESGDGGNSIVAITDTNSPMYKISKSAPSEYIVRLFGTRVSDTVASPVLSTSADGLIRAVRATTEGPDTLLRIFAKPESQLDINPEANGEIAIIASMAGVDDLRAQPNPEILTESSKDAPAVSPNGSKEIVTASSNGEPDYQRFLGDQPKYTGRLISLDLQETDIDNALRIIAEVSNLNIIASEDVSGKVTLRLIDVPWDQALDVILKTNGLDKVQEGNVVRIAPVERLKNEREALKQAKQAEEELEELEVKYLRVSYARAADLKPLVDSVVTERGLVSYDERTNQLIVRDIKRGLKNVAELVSKIDLRTPQVLLETQIVEATRNLLRDIGSQLGFNYVQSPQTGNATGSNFPNSIQLGGALSNPAATTTNSIQMLLGSADGTKSLSEVVTALEQEGTVRIISRPAVATTNNKPAVIKSIEKIRIRLPQGGVSVATGQGASAAGQGNAATETIEIGIVLTVTPQASPDYYVLLDMDAKSSTLGNQSVDGIPSEVERSARSSVLISSGQTFALGGIYKTTDQTDLNGLPFFKDIPVFGTFFRRANGNNRDEELLFFVTPRIVEGSFDDASMKTTI
jgi:type IV pilus secretin PilQ/predicted competence protein